MPNYAIDDNNALYFDYTPPVGDGGVTFVYFNALTAPADMWRATVVPAFNAQGHGSLLWNYRGQADSLCAADSVLDDRLLAADAQRLLDHVRPIRPVLVGLSIGGLFAAQACLAGAAADGLVLINTLRKPGPRLDWINDAALRCMATGGPELLKDLFGALIFNDQWLAENRAGAFADEPYVGMADDHGHHRLLRDCRAADWDLPYEKLALPVLVLTGLQDNMFFVADDVADLAGRLPNAERVDFADSGHMVPLERPDAFIRTLAGFAARL